VSNLLLRSDGRPIDHSAQLLAVSNIDVVNRNVWSLLTSAVWILLPLLVHELSVGKALIVSKALVISLLPCIELCYGLSFILWSLAHVCVLAKLE